MIVVVGSRHDPVACELVSAWPDARLSSAQDLTREGWAWSSDADGPRRWIVDGEIVPDDDITGVFVRRSAVYPEELAATHRDDRAFLAAEAHAFLIFVLATTRARVVNPVDDGAFGEETLRPERWMGVARQAGIELAPLRLASDRRRRRKATPRVIEVACGHAFGTPARLHAQALELARGLDLAWAVLLFDARDRLLHVTATSAPSASAAEMLGAWLSVRAS